MCNRMATSVSYLPRDPETAEPCLPSVTTTLGKLFVHDYSFHHPVSNICCNRWEWQKKLPSSPQCACQDHTIYKLQHNLWVNIVLVPRVQYTEYCKDKQLKQQIVQSDSSLHQIKMNISITSALRDILSYPTKIPPNCSITTIVLKPLPLKTLVTVL